MSKNSFDTSVVSQITSHKRRVGSEWIRCLTPAVEALELVEVVVFEEQSLAHWSGVVCKAHVVVSAGRRQELDVWWCALSYLSEVDARAFNLGPGKPAGLAADSACCHDTAPSVRGHFHTSDHELGNLRHSASGAEFNIEQTCRSLPDAKR